jgi:HEAT repeat protein
MGPVDDAIRDWLRDERPSHLDRLITLGPKSLRRVIGIYYRGDAADIDVPRSGREMVDAWSSLLAGLAQAYPDVFLKEVRAGAVRMGPSPTLEMVILGGIADPRAAALLRDHLASPDWLVRLHAVRGLAGRTDAESIAAVKAAQTDEHESVRREAIRINRRKRRPDA